MFGTRSLLILALAALMVPAARAGDDDNALAPATKSPRAKRMRAQADALWTAHKKLYESLRKKRDEVDVAAVTKAVADIEEAIALYEKAAKLEWNAASNRAQAEAMRAWFVLKPLVPEPQPPEDAEERKRWEKKQQAAKKKRLRDARKFIMEYSRARRYGQLFNRCRRCEGRKDLRSPFGDKAACPVCSRRGIMPNKKEIVRAHWYVYSPLHRADARNERDITRILRSGHTRPNTLGPFYKSLAIQGEIEDHDTWVRIHTKEQTHEEAKSKRYQKGTNSYVLIRVGKLWYLYNRRHDRDLVDVPELPKPEDEGK